MKTSEKIKTLRQQKGISQEALGELVGVKKAAINKYETGRVVNIKRSTLQKLADALGVLPADLLDDPDSTQPDINVAPITLSSSGRIKVYGHIAAGIPVEANQDIIGEIDVPAGWVDDHAALVVKGDSMFPKYQDGDTIIFREQPDCESGQDCVVYVNGYDATLKTVYKKDGGILLQPINPAYDPMFYGPDDDPIMIAGVIVEIRRKV